MSGAFMRRISLRGLLLLAWTVFSASSTAIDPPQTSIQPKNCTVFTHMVKSGGTTVKDHLIEASIQYDAQMPGASCSTAGRLLEGATEACDRDLHYSSVITSPFGELLRFPLKEIGRQCDFFTMMRHPIDRLVSAFFYCPIDHDLDRRASKWCSSNHQPNTTKPLLMEYATSHWGNKAMDQMILSTLCPRKFVDICSEKQGPRVHHCARMDPGLRGACSGRSKSRNLAISPGEVFRPARAKQVVGRPPQDMSSPVGLDLLEQAQETLTTYKAVGIFEHFELSMALFNAVVVSPVRNWTANTHSNPGIRSYLRQELLVWARLNTELRRFLAPDLMIYDQAVSIFQQQTAAELGTKW